MLNEISFKDFRRKHPSEYEELLYRLSLHSLDKVVLKISGIRSLMIYSIGDRRYYSCLADGEVNPIIKKEVFGTLKEDIKFERYLLTIGLCFKPLFDEYEKLDDTTFVEHIEYAMLIKDRKAYFGLVSMEKCKQIRNLVAIFLYTVGRPVDIDAISILVPTTDNVFLDALTASGYTIGEERRGCYNVVKGTVEDLSFIEVGSTNLIRKP